jgi:hypothetical protein
VLVRGVRQLLALWVYQQSLEYDSYSIYISVMFPAGVAVCKRATYSHHVVYQSRPY